MEISEEKKEFIKQFTKECSSEYYKTFHKKERHKQYKDNRDKIKKQNKLYSDNHKEYYKQYRNDHKKENRNWQNNKWKTDLKYKLNKAMSYQIWFALKDNKLGQHWEDLVDYNLSDLIKRLKKTMPNGYIWGDYLYGELHVDHIIPKSAFNFTTHKHIDFKRCWALSNLQLLPAKENYQKKDKLNKPFQLALKL